MVLKRDADFWRDELEFPFTLLSAELIIHPSDGSPDVVWNEGNGKLDLPSPEVIRFSIALEEVAEYAWSEGEYCLSIVFSNGKRDGSYMKGPVQIEDACLPTS